MRPLQTTAPAKINLTLSVLSKRADGYHELSSLVAFAETGDELVLEPGAELRLAVEGPMAEGAGETGNNLVIKAARNLQARIPGLATGHFRLTKELPAGAGLGGGSADAAAALRLLAQANGLPLSDTRILEAARDTGADVPVCLESKPRLMHGIGEILSPPIELPKLDAVIVFPGAAVATKDVFGNFTLAAGPRRKTRYGEAEIPREREALFSYLASEMNDLELAARLAASEISGAKGLLEEIGDARLVRMTGSGSAVFALYDNAPLAKRAAAKVKKRRPDWWAVQTTLG